MSNISPESPELPKLIEQQLRWRYATKRFDPTKKIPDSLWSTLEDSLHLSPSSYGMQPWKFLIVQSAEARKLLTPLSWNQPQVEECSHFVVIAYHQKVTVADVQRHINRIAEVRNASRDSLLDYENRILSGVVQGPGAQIAHYWAQRQCYLALGFLLETAALLGIDACPMEGIDPRGYDKALELEGTPYKTVVAAALGYRSPDDKYQHAAKVRFDKKDVFKII